MKRLLLAACAVALLSSASFARDGARKAAAPASPASSERQMGLGYTQISGVNSLSLRYWTNDKLGFEGIFGFSLGENDKIIDIAGKVLPVIKKEQNLTLYGFGVLGIENQSIKSPVTGDTASDTSVLFGAGVGAEFFLQGLPNLGFGTEIGIAYSGATKVFGTYAGYMSSVGVRYYF
jgi:hypothetical protein